MSKFNRVLTRIINENQLVSEDLVKLEPKDFGKKDWGIHPVPPAEDDTSPKEKVFENDQAYVVKPESWESAVSWTKDLKHKLSPFVDNAGGRRMWNLYVVQDHYNFFIVVNKNAPADDPKKALAVAVGPQEEGEKTEYFTMDDKPIKEDAFNKEMAKLNVPLFI